MCLEYNFVEYINLNAEAFFHYADCSSHYIEDLERKKHCGAHSTDKAHRQRMGTDNKRQIHSNQSYKHWQIEKILTDSDLLVLQGFYYPRISLFQPNSHAHHPWPPIILSTF